MIRSTYAHAKHEKHDKKKKRGVNFRGPLLPDERVLADTLKATRIHLHHSLKDLDGLLITKDKQPTTHLRTPMRTPLEYLVGYGRRT